MQTETHNRNWETLKAECLACTRCALSETRTQVVFGVGNPESEVLLIGEGPGQEEDIRGEPFVGRAGQLLDVMLASVGIKRENIYIANIVKCRPPNNRDPLNIEQDACIGWLREQTKLMRPKIIVCLGRVAAMKIIKPDYKITSEHGQWIEKSGFWMTAFYHPAFLLRDPRHKPDTFSDMKSLESKMREICTKTLPD
ncbi:MAG: uracil-DNA glycosylase [Oscillospiraceae bacterium]|nr:uracil-DNA glycosylase [Oscillospiraceae bacterium]